MPRCAQKLSVITYMGHTGFPEALAIRKPIVGAYLLHMCACAEDIFPLNFTHGTYFQSFLSIARYSVHVNSQFSAKHVLELCTV